MKCILCHEREATVPDRDRPGRPIKRVCRECHVKRLQDDLRRVLELEFGKRRIDDTVDGNGE